ncbi:MAG TPA: hypothetical protein VML55_13295 [Planctomycetaceae bacterium]|nr:hypothetical protein [Planctomycetaceae bacterium]
MLAILVITIPALGENPSQVSPANLGGGEDARQRDPWYGFPVGSWIVESETLKQDRQQAQTRREKTERIEGSSPLALKPDDIVLAVRPERDGEFSEVARSHRHVPGAVPATMEHAKLIETRRAAVEIDGGSYQCEVKKWRVTIERPGIDATYTLWYAQGLDVPYRELSLQGPDLAMPSDVLRAEVEIKGPNYTDVASLEVKSLMEERKIGTQVLMCVREEGRFQSEVQGQKLDISVRSWLSKQVPGHRVRSEAEGTLGGRRVERVREVLEFHVPGERTTHQE